MQEGWGEAFSYPTYSCLTEWSPLWLHARQRSNCVVLLIELLEFHCSVLRTTECAQCLNRRLCCTTLQRCREARYCRFCGSGLPLCTEKLNPPPLKSAVLNVWIRTIKNHVFLMVLEPPAPNHGLFSLLHHSYNFATEPCWKTLSYSVSLSSPIT